MDSTRRLFCTQAVSSLLASRLFGQSSLAGGSSIRPNVAAIDHDRILSAADRYLKQTPAPITEFHGGGSPGSAHDFYSDPEEQPNAFVAHRDSLFALGHIVPALTSAYVITKDERYAKHAVLHLQEWFVTPETAMVPSLQFAQVAAGAKTGRPEGVIEGLPLVEIAQCVPFLSNSEALTPATLDTITRWFTSYLDWLNTSRTAGLARDMHDHNGSSWLLQAAASAKLNPKDDSALTTLRHQFRTSTIRAQITSDGNFVHELATPNPYRNTLFNVDLLAGCCELLSTRFESVWDYELQDGPGMRAVIARLFPFIGNRGSWPYRADAAFFSQLPLRRPALLFAARVYNRPEYADLWKTLPADTAPSELDRTFPIRQPLLWVTRPHP
ncbi:MAG: alginate lyase family protein [Acidobacteria bacterium]|nr:alginate lyase family protein [Acidobacteriota bacterium]